MKIKLVTTLFCSVGLLGISMNAYQEDASAHGYVESPASRGYQGFLEKQTGYEKAIQKYGSVINEPQSLEAPKGFPEAGPADGQLASAGGKFGGILDIQTSTYWDKRTDIDTGMNTFTWKYTATHPTSKWHYYMTKSGWNQNSKLKRSEMDLIGTVEHDGSQANTKPSHKINIPKDRKGYHVIYVAWDVADTANAFYNVIDVNVKEDSSIPEIPTAPKNFKLVGTTNTTIAFNWESQPSIATYNVYRDGKKIASPSSSVFEDKDLIPGTSYTYEVEAIGNNGLISKKSEPFKAETTSSEDEKNKQPTKPSGLHSMGETTNSISLMWNPSTHISGIKEYQIIRDGKLVKRTDKTNFKDTNLKEGTKYTYVVKAISKNNLTSEASDKLTITTTPTKPEGRIWKVGTFSSPELYTSGEEVIYLNKIYVVIQTHRNYGDAEWSPDKALALFRLKL
ncbi:lytic polysaccharide monooxygenase [Enterococcus faecalis]|uniref:lytic polysaccharide monooxygenase n=1 Tax=Enterococcus faecalis TaxID=1351 RepID=UPI00242A3C58|nr:lytic polysaccharide monooxygenase [Enterococcus faecalis]